MLLWPKTISIAIGYGNGISSIATWFMVIEMGLVLITHKLASGRPRAHLTYLDPRLTLYWCDAKVRLCQDASITWWRMHGRGDNLAWYNGLQDNTKSITLELSLFQFQFLHGHGAYDGKISIHEYLNFCKSTLFSSFTMYKT
jgi:hypothetical protein